MMRQGGKRKQGGRGSRGGRGGKGVGEWGSGGELHSPVNNPNSKSSKWRKVITSTLALAALVGSVGLVSGCAWLAVQLIVNPDGVVWINRYLPKWTRIPIKLPESVLTLEQIQAEVSQQEMIPGEVLLLGDSETTSDLLLPVLKQQPNCETNCQQIVELKVYQPTELEGEKGYYRLVNEIAIAPIEESAVISDDDNSVYANSDSRSLPLTNIELLDPTPPNPGAITEPGIWLNVKGQTSGDKPISYGQIIHYNPSQTHLSVMLSWSSPTNETPKWQEVTGSKARELIINQTVGLEPQFRVYQLKPRKFTPDPIFLEEISVSQSALETISDDQLAKTYRNILLLARSGLWSSAWQLWQSVQYQEDWPTDVQAQMDVIHLHAQFSQSQAKKPWANANQQIQASLIDGRWQDALLVFQAADANQRYEIVQSLKADTGRLWRRVEAANSVNANNNDVKAWGALILAAKHGRAKAIAWLQPQLQTKAQKPEQSDTKPQKPDKSNPEKQEKAEQQDNSAFVQINELLNQLEATLFDVSIINSHLSQIVGAAIPLSQINSVNWTQITEEDSQPAPLKLEAQQIWYQVQVSTFHDGQRWRKEPFADLTLSSPAAARFIRKLLGLDTDSRIQLTGWNANGEQENTIATVKAAQIQSGVLNLLVAGEVLPQTKAIKDNNITKLPRLLAHTEQAFSWRQPDFITIRDISDIQPQWGAVLLPTLWRELQKAGKRPIGGVPNLSEILKSIGHWSVQPVDLTGNNQPEAVLTLYQDASGIWQSLSVNSVGNESNISKRRTLIFSDTGALLYNEFAQNNQGSLSAIADMSDNNVPALVVKSSNTYKLKRWSTKTQKFE